MIALAWHMGGLRIKNRPFAWLQDASLGEQTLTSVDKMCSLE